MDRAAEINHRKIDNYETKVDRYLSGEKAEDFYKIGGSTVSPDKLKILFDDPSEQRKAQFDQVHGPGAANLELSRFRRAKQRRGED
jgi:predicted P-loop ATPase